MIVGLAATGCTTAPKTTGSIHTTKRLQTGAPGKVTYNYTTEDRSCLKRAMYFESQHSDHDGYMAVGSVVMNRLTSPAYPKSICGVVSQAKQFAPGVMTREVKVQAEPELDAAADALLKGERNPDVKEAMFFHTDGLKFPYDNMHYVAVAGGNAFYEKRGADGELQTPSPLPAYEVAMNYVPNHSNMAAQFELLTPPVSPTPTPIPMAEGVVETAYEAPAEVPVPQPAPMQVAAAEIAAPPVQQMQFKQPAIQQAYAPQAASPQATFETVAFTIPTAVAVPMPRPATFDNARMRGNIGG
jgi:spore germination cell wall hydrolase CwlJ-like protein